MFVASALADAKGWARPTFSTVMIFKETSTSDHENLLTLQEKDF